MIFKAIEGLSTNYYAYSHTGLLTNEVAHRGSSASALTRSYDHLGRPAGLTLSPLGEGRGEGTAPYALTYGYDEYGRLGAVSNAAFNTTYSYYPGGSSAGWTTVLTNGTIISCMTIRDPYRGLVTAVSNTVNGVVVSAYHYSYDALGRVVSRNTDTFGYNPCSELTSVAMGTNAYSYVYDGVGNRLSATENNIALVYHTNPLNQYTNIFRDFVSSCEPQYDLDGNMTVTGDGWHYIWNSENRLIVASNDMAQVTYAYDYRGRMVYKTIGTIGQEQDKTIAYLWDDYNIIVETVVQSGVTSVTYNIWGLDISGIMQGAGGVGGLLAVIRDGEPFFPCYDANGNITEYLDINGVVVAHYEYDPFGNIIVQSGELAAAFTHRFSTKPWCHITGLSEYEFRKYSPSVGRWLSRDPVGEEGDANLYGFVGNRVIWAVDVDGRQWFAPPGSPSGGWNAPPRSVAGPLLSLPQYDPCANGFCVVGSLIERQIGARLLQVIGIQHVDIFYKGHMVYLGRGGGEERWGLDSKNTFVDLDTYPLSKATSGYLKYGDAKCKKCHETVDTDILSCLSRRKPSLGNNCQGDVLDATKDCCLCGFRTWVSTFFYWALAAEQ